MCFKKILNLIRKDRDHHIRITKDYVAGFSDVPDYYCDDFKIENKKITVFATSSRPLEIDGATLAPDKIGNLDLAAGYILHDLIYTHLEDIAKTWNRSSFTVRKWADCVLQNAIEQQSSKHSKTIANIYYFASRMFGGIAHFLGKFFILLMILIYMNGCASSVFITAEEPCYKIEID